MQLSKFAAGLKFCSFKLQARYFFQASAHYFKDVLVDGCDGGLFGEYRDTVLIASRYLAILFINPRVELIAFALKTIFVGASDLDMALVASAGSAQGGGERGKKQNREVRLNVIADGTVHGEDAVGAEIAAGALVGFGAVGVAIAEDDRPFGEGRENDLPEGLCAVGEHESHLGFWGDGAEVGLAAGIQQDRADAVAKGCAARLAKGDDAMAGGFERGGEMLELRCLA